MGQRVSADHFRKSESLTAALTQRFGRGDLIMAHSHPYLYLNLKCPQGGRARSRGGIAYDTHVPIIFAGHRVGAQKIKRQRVARSAAEITHRMSRLNRGFLGGSCRQRALVHGSRIDSIIMPSPTRSHAR